MYNFITQLHLIKEKKYCLLFHSLHSFTSRNGFSKMKKLSNNNISKMC